MKITITVPAEWLPVLRALAKRQRISLSRLLYESAAKQLSDRERDLLPTPRERGRPKS